MTLILSGDQKKSSFIMLSAYLSSSIDVLQRASSSIDNDKMEAAVNLCVKAARRDLPILICGNGGSAADAAHIAGELVGRFLLERRPINAICLSSNPSIMTAWANDYSYEDIFARQIEAYARRGGVLIAISTSGNSANVIRAASKAREMNLSVISLTGENGGKLAAISDVLLAAPSSSTPFIQQVHICLYHFLCARIEARIAAELSSTSA